jgi:CRP-like cAMP-binding protein
MQMMQRKKQGLNMNKETSFNELGSLKREFTAMAIENCELMTLSKADLTRVDLEFEDIVAEMFAHVHKKIRRALKIRDEVETEYIKK